MKRKTYWAIPFMLISGIAITGCNTNSNVTNPISSIKKLDIASLPSKVEYGVGEAFTSAGLKVNIVEVVDGKVISTTPTTDFVLSMDEGTILEEGEQEIMVISNDEAIRSISFKINVKVSVKLQSVYDIVKQMYETNNYTVTNKVGTANDVKGLITKDALIWDSTEAAYFADEDFGYGSYEGDTFRFKLSSDNKVTDAKFIKDLGAKAKDNGLFNETTVDDLADRRVSNYNMRSIDTNNWDHLKTELEASEDNLNRYELDSSQCRWLFNAIGHTQLSFNPGAFLKNILVYVEIKDYGLDVDVVPTSNTDGIVGCSAKITNIGTTKIPGMDEFMANPTFIGQSNTLQKFKQVINSNHYEFIYKDKRNVVFTNDYIYGVGLDEYNVINLKENNNLNKTPGYYQVSLNNQEVNIGEQVNKTIYLNQFGLFKHLDQYFVKDSTNLNKFRYDINLVKEHQSDLSEFMEIFTTYTTQTIKSVELDFVIENEQISKVKLSIISSKGILDTFDIANINTAKNDVLDAKIKTLY